MKLTARIVLTLAAIAILASSSAAQGFEGVITMNLTIPQLSDSPVPMTIEMKGKKSVTSMTNPMAGEMKIYQDASTMKRIIVMGGKMGYETDMNKNHEGADTEKIVPVDAHQKKTINGYGCSLYTIEMSKGSMELWMTADLPKDVIASLSSSFSGGLGGMRGAGGSDDAFTALLAKGLAPIQTIIRADGKIAATMDLVKYEKKSIADADLTVPADVKVQPMPDMMGGPH